MTVATGKKSKQNAVKWSQICGTKDKDIHERDNPSF
jgi:hypothetical protein